MKLSMIATPLMSLVPLLALASFSPAQAGQEGAKAQVDVEAREREAAEADRIRHTLLEEGWWQADSGILQWVEEQRGRPPQEVENERAVRVRIRESEALQELMACAPLAGEREAILMRVLTERYRDLGAQAGAILLQAGASSHALDIARAIRDWEVVHIGRVLSALRPDGDASAWLPLARTILEELLGRAAPSSPADDPAGAYFRALRIVAQSALAQDRMLVESGALARPHDAWSWILASRVPLSAVSQRLAYDLWNDAGRPLDLRLAAALVARHVQPGPTDAQIVDQLVPELARRLATSEADRKLPSDLRSRNTAQLVAILYECDRAAVAARVPDLVTGRPGLLNSIVADVLARLAPEALLDAASRLSELGRSQLAAALFDVGERSPALKSRARSLVPSVDLQRLEAEPADVRRIRTAMIFYTVVWRPRD